MDLKPMVGATYRALADTLEQGPDSVWDAPSLCEGWRVREVVSHVTMPARFTGEQFGRELEAVGGDFGTLSDTLATRDSGLPVPEQLANLRSPVLGGWEPPGGGIRGALNHAVIHSLDVTLALGAPTAAPDDALRAILDEMLAGGAARFDVDVTDRRFVAIDLDWAGGTGTRLTARASEIVALLARRTLPDGRTLAG